MKSNRSIIILPSTGSITGFTPDAGCFIVYLFQPKFSNSVIVSPSLMIFNDRVLKIKDLIYRG